MKSAPSQYFSGQAFDEGAGNLTKRWSAENFAGFWREPGTNISTETLVIDQDVLDGSHRVIEKNNLIYTTKSIPVKYQVYVQANETPPGTEGSYSAIGWLGEKYVSLQGNRISKILFEQNANEAKTMTSGESWKFDDEYTVRVNSVDVRTIRQVWFTFFNYDNLIEEAILGDNYVYTYQEKSNYSAPIFVTHVSNYRSLPESDVVDFDYTWLRSQK